jgi:adenosylcobyric acid synthase
MLARWIDDSIESGSGRVAALGLLPTTVTFGAGKVLARTKGSWAGRPVEGYEIHHGVADIDAGHEPFLDGCRLGSVWGTMWHGAFENDDFRRTWLTTVTGPSNRPFQPIDDAIGFGERREAMIDGLADAVAENLDTAALLDLVGH